MKASAERIKVNKIEIIRFILRFLNRKLSPKNIEDKSPNAITSFKYGLVYGIRNHPIIATTVSG